MSTNKLSPTTIKAATIAGFFVSLVILPWQTFGTTGHIDMIIYRAGAEAYLAGGSLYDEPFTAYDLKLPFIYPPFAALLLAPFTFVSGDTAGYLMVASSGLLMLVCVWFLMRYLIKNPQLRWLATSWAWALSLVAEPLRQNASFAQINMWLLALVFLDIVPRKRILPQGWLIGVAAAIKLTPLVMLFVFLIKKDWRALLSAAGGALAATAVGAVINPKQTWAFYTDAIFVMNDNSKIGVNVAYISNQSIKGVLTRLWPSNDAANAATHTINLLWLVLALSTVVAFFFVIKRLLHHDLFLEAALANSVLMLLISPISWSHHWVWLPLWFIVLAYYAWGLQNRFAQYFGLSTGFFFITIPPHWWLGDPKGDQDFQQILYMKLFMDDYFSWAIILVIILYLAAPQLAALRDTAREKAPA
jgi:hypothetical protein